MINSSSISPKQLVVLKEIKAMFGKNVVSRTELVEYANKHDQVYAPGFIVKNEFYKARDKSGKEIRGMYKIPTSGSTKKSKSENVETTEPVVVEKTKKTAVTKVSKAKKTPKVVAEPVIETEEAQNRALLLEEDVPEVAMSASS